MPPSRVRYASYYHIWTTICLNDKPETGWQKPTEEQTVEIKFSASVFEEFRKNKDGKLIVLQALEKTNQGMSLLHIYCFLTVMEAEREKKEICEVIKNQCNKAKMFSINYTRNVMSGMCWTEDWKKEKEEKHKEFLFLMEK